MGPLKSESVRIRPDEQPMRPTKQQRLAEAEESRAAEAQGSKAAEAQQQKVAEAQGPKKFAFDYAKQTPKFRYCLICMKNDHSAPLCPYGRYCSPDVTVGPDAAIVCTCCHDDPKTAHPVVADVEIVTRAVLKSSLPPSMWYCRICMKNDHSAPLCPYGRYCSPDVTVGPHAAIVCTCCHADPKTAHPVVADVEIVTRAVLKRFLPPSMW